MQPLALSSSSMLAAWLKGHPDSVCAVSRSDLRLQEDRGSSGHPRPHGELDCRTAPSRRSVEDVTRQGLVSD